MEKFAFVKVLNRLKNENIKIEMLTTDRHSQIRKHMQEEEKNIDHQFDVWYFCKNIKQKLNKVSKKANCNDLRPWIKSIAHHFWWGCSKCEGDAQILRQKLLSIIFHVQNIHHSTGFAKFHMCYHAPLSTEKKRKRKKNWLSPKHFEILYLAIVFLKIYLILLSSPILVHLKFIIPLKNGFQKAFISQYMA